MLGDHMIRIGYPATAALAHEPFNRRSIVVLPDDPIWCPSPDGRKFHPESTES